MRIILTSFGVALYSKLIIMALMPTDFPEPVVPAIRRCGIFCRSATIGLPAISFPKATVKGESISSNVFDLSISPKTTRALFSFGISIPIKDFPSITSTTLTLETESDLAKSLERLLI